jgi:hypothetical protein
MYLHSKVIRTSSLHNEPDPAVSSDASINSAFPAPILTRVLQVLTMLPKNIVRTGAHFFQHTRSSSMAMTLIRFSTIFGDPSELLAHSPRHTSCMRAFLHCLTTDDIIRLDVYGVFLVSQSLFRTLLPATKFLDTIR